MRAIKLLDIGSFFAIFFVVLSNIVGFSASAEDGKEYLIKAAFIVNFTKFIDWPDDKAIAKQQKIDVCVLGENPLINLSQVFKQASSAKLAVSLVKENNLSNIVSHCHVVFIGASEEYKYKDVLDVLKNKPILTVGDSADFTERGGMMGLPMDNNKVKLVVNKKAIETAGMYVDSQLLEIASKVIDN